MTPFVWRRITHVRVIEYYLKNGARSVSKCNHTYMASLDQCFFLKLTHGDLNCPMLLATFDFRVPHCKIRQLNNFHVLLQRSKYGLHAPLNRLMQLATNLNFDLYVNNSIDYFNVYLKK